MEHLTRGGCVPIGVVPWPCSSGGRRASSKEEGTMDLRVLCTLEVGDLQEHQEKIQAIQLCYVMHLKLFFKGSRKHPQKRSNVERHFFSSEGDQNNGNLFYCSDSQEIYIEQHQETIYLQGQHKSFISKGSINQDKVGTPKST